MLLKKFDTRSVLYIRHGDLLILAVWSEILKLYAVQSQLRFLEQFLCFFEHMLTAVPPAGNLEDALNCLLFIKITLSWNPEQRKKTLLHGYSPPASPPPFKSGPWSLNKKWHPPLTMTPKSPTSGVSTQGTKCLGQTPMPSSPDYLGSPLHLPSHLP